MRIFLISTINTCTSIICQVTVYHIFHFVKPHSVHLLMTPSWYVTPLCNLYLNNTWCQFLSFSYFYTPYRSTSWKLCEREALCWYNLQPYIFSYTYKKIYILLSFYLHFCITFADILWFLFSAILATCTLINR